MMSYLPTAKSDERFLLTATHHWKALTGEQVLPAEFVDDITMMLNFGVTEKTILTGMSHAVSAFGANSVTWSAAVDTARILYQDQAPYDAAPLGDTGDRWMAELMEDGKGLLVLLFGVAVFAAIAIAIGAR